MNPSINKVFAPDSPTVCLLIYVFIIVFALGGLINQILKYWTLPLTKFLLQILLFFGNPCAVIFLFMYLILYNIVNWGDSRIQRRRRLRLSFKFNVFNYCFEHVWTFSRIKITLPYLTLPDKWKMCFRPVKSSSWFFLHFCKFWK